MRMSHNSVKLQMTRVEMASETTMISDVLNIMNNEKREKIERFSKWFMTRRGKEIDRCFTYKYYPCLR